MTLLTEANMTLLSKNCEFFTNRMGYLGHAIPPGHPKVSKRTIDVVPGLKYPKNVTGFQSFLDLCKVLQLFVPNFNRGASPLNKKRRERQLQNFDGLSNEGITALETLKAKVESACSTDAPTFAR